MAPARAGAFRRLASAAYDGLLLLAALMILTALAQLATDGAAITHASVGRWEYLYRALLAATVVGYFGAAWTRRGQTLGMKAWRIRIETTAGALPSWRKVLLRLALAAPLYLAIVATVALYVLHRAGWWLPALGALPLALDFGCDAWTGRGTLTDRLSRTRIALATASRTADPDTARPGRGPGSVG